jgi:hypothetical protein
MKTYRTFALLALVAGFLTLSMTSDAHARRHRRGGGSSYNRYQAQLRAYQKQMEDMARTMREQSKAVERVVLQTFDKNGNGKIDSTERGAAEGFLRHMRMGVNDKVNGGTLAALQQELVQIADRKGQPASTASSSNKNKNKKKK